ncbi:helix-turn-helix domain-containing protein [Mobiluncus sp.]|uniref:helix-turn-helix domain-containing protein n=1 Tax=Mobiluncus sp. TaxID=47293 RepID=UPI002A90C41D|nr:helix-turn-helix domain-containing protein [Mobiluncus sp.]MDY6077490.1 helix-turn-helix domain-containing protein [Mobiluncus sp.]
MGTYSPSSDRTHYLTLQEAVAEGFGAYSTLRSWIAQGRLPAYKTGNRVKVLREDLEALAVPMGIDPVEPHIKALVDAAPRLSDDQIARLRVALGGGSR